MTKSQSFPFESFQINSLLKQSQHSSKEYSLHKVTFTVSKIQVQITQRKKKQRPTLITQMLEMVDKNFKANVIIMLSGIKENMLTTNETMRNLSIEIETKK